MVWTSSVCRAAVHSSEPCRAAPLPPAGRERHTGGFLDQQTLHLAPERTKNAPQESPTLVSDFEPVCNFSFLLSSQKSYLDDVTDILHETSADSCKLEPSSTSVGFITTKLQPDWPSTLTDCSQAKMHWTTMFLFIITAIISLWTDAVFKCLARV